MLANPYSRILRGSPSGRKLVGEGERSSSALHDRRPSGLIAATLVELHGFWQFIEL